MSAENRSPLEIAQTAIIGLCPRNEPVVIGTGSGANDRDTTLINDINLMSGWLRTELETPGTTISDAVAHVNASAVRELRPNAIRRVTPQFSLSGDSSLFNKTLQQIRDGK